MRAQFVDTYYLLALLNSKDSGHEAALRQSRSVQQLVITGWVMVEFADALATTKSRSNAAGFLREFLAQPFVELIPPTGAQLERVLELYERRPDKQWSLTDCTSFGVMESRGIHEALTADHHFEQAGFRAMLRNTSI